MLASPFRTLFSLGTLALSCGCLVPRSGIYGQPAVPVRPGAAEVAASVGFAGYEVQNAPPQSTAAAPGQPATTAASTTRALASTSPEINLLYGLTEELGFNLHAGPGGAQPGFKWTVLRGPLAIAFLPQLGAGYFSVVDNTTVLGGGQTQTGTTHRAAFLFSAGLRGLLSHRSGLYGGVGYEFQHLGAYGVDAPAGGSQVGVQDTVVQHHLSAALGFDINLGSGSMKIRPEIAFVYTPSVSNWSRVGSTGTVGVGGSGFLVQPSLTFALRGRVPDRPDIEDYEGDAQDDAAFESGR